MVKMKQLFVSAAIFAGMALSGQVLAAAGEGTGLMSPAKIDERTRPDAVVCVQGEECKSGATAAAAPAPAAATPAADVAAASAPAAASKPPEEIFNGTCAMCHQTGAAGAPKLGDKAAWAPRIAQGMDTLHKHAISGLNAMPPKGLCATCSDADVMAVVDYMVSQSK